MPMSKRKTIYKPKKGKRISQKNYINCQNNREKI